MLRTKHVVPENSEFSTSSQNEFSPKSIVAETPAETTIKQTKTVQSLFPAHLIYIGAKSGKAYEWKTSGAVAVVDADDVPDLLEKHIGERACCGASGNGNRLFEVL